MKNKDDFQDLLRAAEGLNVKWVHVKGHCGIEGNERADQLATASLKLPLPSSPKAKGDLFRRADQPSASSVRPSVSQHHSAMPQPTK